NIGAFFHIILKDMGEARSLAADVQRLNQQLEYYKQELSRVQGAKYSLANIIGDSPAICALRQELLDISRSSSTVLITGETGCGKELVAHTIHSLSLRQTAPFVKVNCAAIPAELMESEFFGYEPGSFTGASRKGGVGKFEMADHGTLFLDEINHLPLSLQPKLLRVLQEREIERVGGGKSIPVDVRILAATNVSLENMIEEERFRQDLYYRLNVLEIHVPPLRERLEDIPILCDSLLKRLNRQLGMEVPSVTDEVKERFMHYAWPGNIRELQNVLERGMNKAWREPVAWEHVKEYFLQTRGGHSPEPEDKQQMSIKDYRKTSDRRYILKVIEQCGGNKKKAAEQLGMSRSMLYRKLEELGIRPE
ncbi:MAG: sigma 54-interacting transcriptional regulator, partial [Oscillospiraceae bacterium]|nr:sigma 54-interacting transcriptional regulator [Oscillospiraceae bacterium]